MRLSKRAFTLVELIIVIAVIGVLAAILIPVFSNVIKKANAKSALADARNAVSVYVTEVLDKRVQGDTSAPENIAIIVAKGGRYYVFGYNTATSDSIQVSAANENGLDASDLDDLIGTQSWNHYHAGTDYDPSSTATYTVESDGAFYLVPYTGTTPDNTNVRGFGLAESTGETYHRLDDGSTGGLALNIGDDTAIYHGCLVGATFDTPANDDTGSSDNDGGEEPPVTHTVTFAIAGVDNEDKANVVIKQNGTPVAGSSVTVNHDTAIATTFSAEYPHNPGDDYWYEIRSITPLGSVTSDMTVTFTFEKQSESYSATYSANGGSGSITDSNTYTSGQTVTLAENSFTAPANKQFAGWKIGTDDTVRQPGYTFPMPAGGVTIYAQWSNAQVNITYKSGSHGTGDDIVVSVDSNVAFNLRTFASTGWTAESGWSFYRWEIGGVEYAENAQVSFTADTTVTAKYADNRFSVEYIQVAGVDSIPSPAKTYYPVGTASVPINYSGVVINELYSRSDWAVGGSPAGIAPTVHQYLENLNTSSVTAGTEITLTPYVVKKGVTISFVSSPSGATGLPSTTSYYYADGLNYTISATPTLGGYDFTGYTLTSATGVNVTLSDEQGRTLTIAKSGSTWASGTATITANFTASAPVTHTITFTDGDNTDTATATNGVSTSLATLNPLSAPSGKELDKFVIGGTDYAKDASYTFTANTAVTVVWKDTPGGSGTNNITLNLKFINSSNGAFYNSSSPITMDVEVANNGTISYTVTQLKQAGKWYTQSGRNYISVTNGTTLSNTGAVTNGGSVLYTVSYTRDDTAESPYDWVLYVAPCRDSVTDSTAYGDSSIPNLNIVPTRTIPGVSNPREINDEFDFEDINYDLSIDYILNVNISLSGNWTPFGHGLAIDGSDLPFTGTLDGNGKTISGLSANWPASGNIEYGNIGLFSKIGYGATIADLTISNATVNGAYYVGILAGENSGAINNVDVSGTVSAYSVNALSNCVGGLVGRNNVTGTITGSDVSVTVNGYYGVGGLVGENLGSIQSSTATVANINATMTLATLRNPTNEVLVEDMAPTQAIGGFVGYNEGIIETTCSATVAANGIIKGYEYVGGFVGYNAATGQISGCTSNGVNIEAYYCAGGFCGYNEAVTGADPHIGSITNSTANVLGINASMTMEYMYNPTEEAEEDDKYPVRIIGGFAGQNEGAITGSVMALDTTSGVIKGFINVGGFAGVNTGSITSSYATNVEAYGAENVGGFVGKNEGSITGTAQSPVYATVKQINGELTDEEVEEYVIQCVGGFVGLNNGADNTHRASITYAYATITEIEENQMGIVGGYQCIGGFAGGNAAYGTITNCYANDVNLYGIRNVGGFVGENASEVPEGVTTRYYGIITNCHLSLYGINNILGDTELTANPVLSIGGFAGLNDAEINTSYVDFNTDAMVTGRQYVGGFVGYNDEHGTIAGIGSVVNNDVVITTPCDASDVILYGYWYVGGFAGQNDGSIVYSTAEVIDIDGYMSTSTMSTKIVNYVGGFCGYNEKTINYCDVTFDGDASGIYGINNVGGFVGYNTYNGHISYSTAANVFILAYNYVGGFAGQNEGSALTVGTTKVLGSISDCTVSVNGINSTMTDSMVANTSYVAGFVGLNDGIISASGSYAYDTTYGYILMGYAKVGGFFGRNTERGEITTSYNKGSYIYGIQLVGGFGGENYGIVSECYANIYAINYNVSASNLSSMAVSFVGGLIGANRGQVANCYVLSAGQVRGAYYVGGLMGGIYNNGTATNCFSDATPYGTNSSALSISYRDGTQTMTSIFFVASSGSSAGATRVTRNAIKQAGFANTCGWSTSTWSFVTGYYPDLVNNPR